MSLSVFLPTALQLYEYGLHKIFDSYWVDFHLKTKIDLHRGKYLPPFDLLEKTLQDGILYHLGLWLFEEYFVEDDDFYIRLEPIQICNYLNQHLYLLSESKCDIKTQEFVDLFLLIDAIDSIDFKKSSNVFKRKKYDYKAFSIIENLRDKYQEDYKNLAKLYALNFAERVFHDREYCEFISYVISSIYDYSGIPFLNDLGTFIIQPVQRKRWPSWVQKTLSSRERGICAKCGANFAEFEGNPQIDHIIPLALGGFNDLVNLQLLCGKCNQLKGAKPERVTSSIPTYITQGQQNWHPPKLAR